MIGNQQIGGVCEDPYNGISYVGYTGNLSLTELKLRLKKMGFKL